MEEIDTEKEKLVNDKKYGNRINDVDRIPISDEFRKKTSASDNKSIEDRETSTTINEMDSTKQRSNAKSNATESKTNSSSLEDSEQSSFSLPENSIDTRSDETLLALHNLTEDKLKGVLELGGFPVPSIAITNQPHTQFGDISVVFDKNTIDPSSRKMRFATEMFDDAYRNSEINKQGNKYSIGGRKAIENAIKQDDANRLLLDNYNKAIQMINKGENNIKIKKETGWYEDTQTGDIKFEFSDKDMELKKQNLIPNKEYTLKELLKHDLLFRFYPELGDVKITFNKNKSDGRFFEKNGEQYIKINQNLLNDELELKSTLIHEIEHAIQKYEGFQQGTTIKKSGKYGYLNNTGEIEADDVADRYKKDVLKERKAILPETGKKKPKHPYIKNDAYILEKIANSIYNYFNGYNKGEKNANFEKNKNNNQKANSGDEIQTRENTFLQGQKRNKEKRQNTIKNKDSKQSSFSFLKNEQNSLTLIQLNDIL